MRFSLGARIAVVLLFLSTPCGAQAPDAPPRVPNWGLYDAIGYAALGFGAGLAVGASIDCGDFVCGETAAWVAGSTLAGAVAGGIIGHAARRELRAGGSPGGAHAAAVALGTVAAGAAAGSLVSILLINGEGEGTPLGSDEQAFALCAAAGAVLGGLYVATHWTGLVGELSFAPTRHDDVSGLALAYRIRF